MDRPVLPPWSGTAPTVRWRPSQVRLLEACEEVDDERWHLCAPPGSGKTLIGLELARRVGRRTLVLSPTTAIRDQWLGACRHLGTDLAELAGSELGSQRTLTSVTYQLLGNPGIAAGELRSVARRMWVENLTAADRNAADRVDALQANDPQRYRRELNTWVRRVRRTLATVHDPTGGRATTDGGPPLPPEHLLGERTTALIDRIVTGGYGTVILDECHHLLDWWALVLAELFERLRSEGPLAVIGLTATLPDPDGAREAGNYLRLLGEVDVTIPMAALVADGELAPWRDGAWLVTPTATELAFLDDQHRHLVDDLDVHLRSDEFVEWAVATILGPALDDRISGAEPHAGAWQSLWDRDPYTAQALTAWWTHRGLALPIDVAPLAPDVPFDADVRLRLLWQFVHHHDCPDGMRTTLTPVLSRHGIALTIGGVRRTRTVSDIVAARSTAKAVGAAEILGVEAQRRGRGLCALVVLEQDRADTPAAVRAAFDEGAGTALRAISTLCGDRTVVNLGVAAVTGRGMWIDALHADQAAALLNVELGGERWLRVTGTPVDQGVDRVVELTGEGPSWTSAVRLDAARRLLDGGVVQVLVATRALVGEGWNHPPLNVLIDLSEAASPAAVTQLRGRAVRLDPGDPTKLSSLWDVVVAHDSATGEWARARRRHLHWWGPDQHGEVVTGPAKASPELDRAEPPAPGRLGEANRRAVAAMTDDALTRRAWAELPPGGTAVAQLSVTPRSRRAVIARLDVDGSERWRYLVGAGAVTGAATATVAAIAGLAAPALIAAAAVSMVVGGAAISPFSRQRARRVEADDPLFWGAVGRAVRDGLVAVGLTGLRDAAVSVSPVSEGHRLDIDARGTDAGAWCDAMTEMLGPPGTPRWLLQHGAEVWRVPGAVGATRAAAEAFHASVARTLPEVLLLRGGTAGATAALVAAPVHHPDLVDRSERWR